MLDTNLDPNYVARKMAEYEEKYTCVICGKGFEPKIKEDGRWTWEAPSNSDDEYTGSNSQRTGDRYESNLIGYYWDEEPDESRCGSCGELVHWNCSVRYKDLSDAWHVVLWKRKLYQKYGRSYLVLCKECDKEKYD